MKKLLLVLFFILAEHAFGQTTDFVFTINIIKTSSAASAIFTIPTTGSGYNYTVQWGDAANTNSTGQTGNSSHDFLNSGTYQIRIGGVFPRIDFNSSNDKLKLSSIDQWGAASWTSFLFSFYNCTNLTIKATDAPNLTLVSNFHGMFLNCSAITAPDFSNWIFSVNPNDLSYMFYGCSLFNGNISNWNTGSVINMTSLFYGCTNFNQNIASWNTAAATNMSYMFSGCSLFNQDLSSWNTNASTTMAGMFTGCTVFNQNIGNWKTGAVTSMANMFQQCNAFNQDISSWNTAAVTDMSSMFNTCFQFNQNIGIWQTGAVKNMSSMFVFCSNFNQDLSTWNTAAVTNMSAMFLLCPAFNQNISTWNTSAVLNMSSMFNNCSLFNGDLSKWNTAKVTSMAGMFQNCVAFNQDISSWNTGSVTDMSYLFYYCNNFNQNLSNWNTAAVKDMTSMFQGCRSFNQDISSWNTAAVTNMYFMFRQCYSFNQALGNLNIGNVTNMTSMLDYTGISMANYDATLTGWNAEAHQNNVSLGANGLSYCAAANQRALLTGTSGWIITNDVNIKTAATPTLVDNYTSQTATSISCIYAASPYLQFTDGAKTSPIKYLAINPNGNTGHNFSITAANNIPFINNKTLSDGSKNTTALSNRMYTIADAGTDNYPTGMTVRIYYSTADSTAAVAKLDQNITGALTSQWFKYSGTNHTTNVANIIANQTSLGINGATYLTPSAYGTENSIAYVEFTGIKNFSTFGFLAAKTAFTLPVKLSSFTATVSNCTVNLMWQTATELNNNYYAVEASTDGSNFLLIAKIAGKNSATGANYDYTYLPGNGTNFYRLKMVDADGKFTYSPTTTAMVNCSNGNNIILAPNPAKDVTKIQGITAGSVIRIYDLEGKKLQEVTATGSIQTINIGKYASGIYLIKIEVIGAGVTTMKVIKQN